MEADTATAQTTERKALRACKGWRFGTKDAKCHVWIELDTEGLPVEGNEYWYQKPFAGVHPNPGAIYEFTIEDQGGKSSVFTGGEKRPMYKGRYDGPDALDWSLRSRAVEAQEAAAKRAVKEKDTDPLIIALKPVKDALSRMLFPQRRAALIVIYEYLLR